MNMGDFYKQEADNWMRSAADFEQRLTKAEAERNRLKIRNDALAAALQCIAAGTADEHPPFRAMGRDQMAEVARDALRALVSTTAPEASNG